LQDWQVQAANEKWYTLCFLPHSGQTIHFPFSPARVYLVTFFIIDDECPYYPYFKKIDRFAVCDLIVK
jgi:hypothetical protein